MLQRSYRYHNILDIILVFVNNYYEQNVYIIQQKVVRIHIHRSGHKQDKKV